MMDYETQEKRPPRKRVRRKRTRLGWTLRKSSPSAKRKTKLFAPTLKG
jgi:hypothetical protein